AAANVAKWDGSGWSALGSGVDDVPYSIPSVYALTVSGSNVYVGGYFAMAGGSPATNVARWNGSSWSALGSGMKGTVNALAVWGSELYAGGSATAGGKAADSIAKWDGSSWSALGSGMDNQVSALAVLGGSLYAGGYFTMASGNPANYVARWD